MAGFALSLGPPHYSPALSRAVKLWGTSPCQQLIRTVNSDQITNSLCRNAAPYLHHASWWTADTYAALLAFGKLIASCYIQIFHIWTYRLKKKKIGHYSARQLLCFSTWTGSLVLFPCWWYNFLATCLFFQRDHVDAVGPSCVLLLCPLLPLCKIFSHWIVFTDFSLLEEHGFPHPVSFLLHRLFCMI